MQIRDGNEDISLAETLEIPMMCCYKLQLGSKLADLILSGILFEYFKMI